MLYWQFQEVADLSDPLERENIWVTVYGKIGLMRLKDGKVYRRNPLTDAFKRMTTSLNGVTSVERLSAERPEIFLFEVQRAGRKPVYVAWEQRDVFTGEDQPATSFAMPWKARAASAQDILGERISVTVENGSLRVPLSVTPVFIESID